MPSTRDVNARARASERASELALPQLQAAYHRAILALGATARRNFVQATHVTLAASALVAADDPRRAPIPNWQVPDLDELFTLQYGVDVMQDLTWSAREHLVLAATGPWADPADPAVRSRITGQVLALLGTRITEVTEHVREETAYLLRQSLDAGDSVRTAARALSAGMGQFAPGRAMLIARTEMIGATNAASIDAVHQIAAQGVAYTKKWLATSDSRTRPTHAAANGQVRALDAPFEVGGALLMYPGAEGAPAAEVCNCRCTLVYEEDTLPPIPAAGTRPATVAEAMAQLPRNITMNGAMRFVTLAVDVADDGAVVAEGTRFEMVMAPIGHPTDDGRILDPVEAGAISWRELPLSLMAQFETAGGHDGAQVAGRIDEISEQVVTVGDYTGPAFVGRGVFDDGPDGSEAGREAARLARSKTLRGVSIDLAPDEIEMRTRDNEPIAEDDDEAWLEAMFGGGLMAVLSGVIMGATITPFPAFAEGVVTVVASIEQGHELAARAPRQFATQVLEASSPLVVAPRLTLEEVEAFTAARDAGFVSVNDVRTWLELQPVEGGDVVGPVASTASAAPTRAVQAPRTAAVGGGLLHLQTGLGDLAVAAPRRMRRVKNAQGVTTGYEEALS